MNGTFVTLLIVEAVLAVLTLTMWMWRGFLDMKEDDHLTLTEAESHLQRDQAAIRAKVNSLSRYIKVFGVVWVVMAVVTFGAWVALELKLI